MLGATHFTVQLRFRWGCDTHHRNNIECASEEESEAPVLFDVGNVYCHECEEEEPREDALQRESALAMQQTERRRDPELTNQLVADVKITSIA